MKQLSLLVLALLSWLPTGASWAACVVDSKAVVGVQLTGGTITVPVEVNGITATFILDTGAQRSLVTQDAVRRLGLDRDPWVATTMTGVGGIDRRPNADPRSLSIAGIKLVRRTLSHDTSLTVGVLPGTHTGNLVIDGLLGRDFLSLFDLDLDVPARRLTLYHVTGCSGRFLPWTGAYMALPVRMEVEDAIILPVALDGKPLQAILDSGASASLLASSGIVRLGLDNSDLSADPAATIAGLGPRVVTAHQHRFRSMTVGNTTFATPVLWVEPVRLMPFADMLLGADWLAERRVWISYASRQVFTASN